MRGQMETNPCLVIWFLLTPFGVVEGRDAMMTTRLPVPKAQLAEMLLQLWVFQSQQ